MTRRTRTIGIRVRSWVPAALLLVLAVTTIGPIGAAAAGPAATAPGVRWTRQFGTAEPDNVEGIAVDALGRTAVVGGTPGSLTGADNLGDQDVFVRSSTAAGTRRWTRQFGTEADDHAKDVAIDRHGNILVAGVTSGDLAATDAGGSDAFVRKIRPDGSVAWTRQFGTISDDEARGVAVDRAGNVYVAGETNGGLQGSPKGGTDAFLRKYSASGVLKWTRQFGTSTADYVDGAAADADGNAWVIGATNGSISGTNAGDFDAYVRGYDTSGALRWTRQFGSGAGDFALDAEADADGNLLIVGSTDGAVPGGGADPAGTDVFVRKLTRSGGTAWTRQLGSNESDYPGSIDVDAKGAAYVAGQTRGTIGVAPAPTTSEVFVRSFGAGGGVRWTVQFGTSSGEEDAAGIAVRRTDEVYVTGTTDGELAAPPKGVDVFVRRYGPPG